MKINVKVVAFYEDHWMPPGTDRAQWDHLCRAYGVDLQMVRSWGEAIIPEDYYVYLIDEAGEVDIAKPEQLLEDVQNSTIGAFPPNIVLVFGRTAQDLTTYIPNDDWYASYKITTPSTVPMFGVNAGAITLFSLYLFNEQGVFDYLDGV